MVPMIRERKIQLLNAKGIEAAFYYAVHKISSNDFSESGLAENALIAIRGFRDIDVNQGDIDKVISKPTTKGIDYSNNIYNLIGIHLACNPLRAEELDAKFSRQSLTNKFAISLFFPVYKVSVQEAVRLSAEENAKAIGLLFQDGKLTQEQEGIINSLGAKENASMIEAVLYEMLIEKFTRFQYNANMNAINMTKHILGNFQYAIKSITGRRQGKTAFEIHDEYDVQDIAYLILKGVFHDLQVENPFMKKAGKSSKIDLITTKEKIAIETKMMLDKYTSKEIIKQLKIDIIDYSTWKEMKDLVIFVYDPKNKISDKSEFDELSGVTENGGVRYTVHVVISN